MSAHPSTSNGLVGVKEYYFPDHDYPVVIEPESPAQAGFRELFGLLEEEKDAIVGRIYTHGAVLLRGFGVTDIESFTKIVRHFASNLMDYLGGDSPRSTVGDKIFTSTEYPAQYRISLHNELSFSKVYPQFLLIYCDIPPEIGGETPLISCRRLLKAIDPAVRERFATKKLKYVQNLPDEYGIGKSWQETFFQTERGPVEEHLRSLGADFEWKDDGTLRVTEIVDAVVKHPVTGEEVFFSQADQWHPSNLDEETRSAMLDLVEEEDLYHNCYFGDGSPIDVADLDHIRAVVERDKVMFPWHKHDVLLVDNLLTMHGRSPYTGDRRILVAMGDP